MCFFIADISPTPPVAYEVIRNLGRFNPSNPGTMHMETIEPIKEQDPERNNEWFRTYEEEEIPAAAYLAFRCPDAGDCAKIQYR